MASVDGSRSFLASSDEVLQHACGPCKDEGETNEAKYFCEKCKEHLCFDCRNDHKKFKATKNHSIVSAHLTQGTGSTATKGAFAILCGCDQKQAVVVYCEKHAEVICPTCETIKHRNCKTCPIKDKVTKDTKKELKELMNKAKSLKAEIENCKKDGEANRTKLDGKKENCKKEIAAFRREINMILDKTEKEILEKLDKSLYRNLQAIEKQIAAMTASLKAMDTNLNTIDNAYKTNRDDVMFSANVKLSKSLSEYDDLIQDIRNGMQLPDLVFQENKDLKDLLKSGEGLGTINTSETGETEQDPVIILDMKVKSKKEVNVELSDDDIVPQITGCAFLSNGRILISDYNNSKVKLLDSEMFLMKSLKLSEEPKNVAAVGENKAIIKFGKSNDFQYIYTHPNLKLGKKITFTEKCLGLCFFNNEIYTTCHKSSGCDEIWRLDSAGNIMSKIMLTQDSSRTSEYLGVCLRGSIPRVYLTDWNRVTCFQLDGKMLYQYRAEENTGTRGIYVDSMGNSLTCGYTSGSIVVITADGRKHGELLKSKDLREPSCIDYRPDNNTLIVGCANKSSLFVCKLGK